MSAFSRVGEVCCAGQKIRRRKSISQLCRCRKRRGSSESCCGTGSRHNTSRGVYPTSRYLVGRFCLPHEPVGGAERIAVKRRAPTSATCRIEQLAEKSAAPMKPAAVDVLTHTGPRSPNWRSGTREDAFVGSRAWVCVRAVVGSSLHSSGTALNKKRRASRSPEGASCAPRGAPIGG